MREKIAIIGSGISGISAAYLLSSKYDVYLFEKKNRLGGHTRTIYVEESTKTIPVDTGFIVFNENNYPDLTNFFKLLDVKCKNSDMSFAVSNQDPQIEYSGKNIFSLFANFRNVFSFDFFKMLFEIRKLYLLCNSLNVSDLEQTKTLNDFLKTNNFSTYLINYHILPMISSIWSSNISDVKNFPLITFINFFKNHALFNLKKRPQWKYVEGGSNEYIKKIINKNAFEYETNFKIKKIIRENNKIKIEDEKNNISEFHKVIFATHANQVLDNLEKPTQEEVKIFSQFKYSTNSAVLHSDETLMPKSKIAWSSWNFLNKSSSSKFTLTYWMNLLQKLPTKQNYFVTVNPFKKPKNIINETTFDHPIYTTDTILNQKKVMQIQGKNNTFFCGAYLGYGFHEDGIQSSSYICKLLNCDLPWKREKNFYNRLQINFE